MSAGRIDAAKATVLLNAWSELDSLDRQAAEIGEQKRAIFSVLKSNGWNPKFVREKRREAAADSEALQERAEAHDDIQYVLDNRGQFLRAGAGRAREESAPSNPAASEPSCSHHESAAKASGTATQPEASAPEAPSRLSAAPRAAHYRDTLSFEERLDCASWPRDPNNPADRIHPYDLALKLHDEGRGDEADPDDLARGLEWRESLMAEAAE